MVWAAALAAGVAVVTVAVAEALVGVDVVVVASWTAVGDAGTGVGVAVAPPPLHALSTPTTPNATNKSFTLHIRKTLLVFWISIVGDLILPLNFLDALAESKNGSDVIYLKTYLLVFKSIIRPA
jgi:hypothetical protein